MPTILKMCQNVASRTGLKQPKSVVGSNDLIANKMLSLVEQEGAELRSKTNWSTLRRRHVITLVEGQSAYPLPSDFESMNSDTAWYENYVEMVNSITPQHVQVYKNGLISPIHATQIRIEGYTDNQIKIIPTPTAGEAGHEINFFYQSNAWIRSKLWEPNKQYAKSDVVTYNGNRYEAVNSGNSGISAPVHTTGSTGISLVWQFLDDKGTTEFKADTDVPLLDNYLLELSLEYKVLRSNGFEWQDKYQMYEEHRKRVTSDLEVNDTLTGMSYTKELDFFSNAFANIPDGSWNI